MLGKCLIGLIIFVVHSSIIAQDSTKTELYLGYFLEDSTTVHSPIKFSRITTIPIQQSKNKVEIRLLTYGFRYQDMIVMSFDTHWSLKYCISRKHNDSTIFKKIERSDLDSVFAVLVTNKIFSLPDDDSLTREKNVLIFDPNDAEEPFSGMSSGHIADGTHYCLEYKVGPYFRRYHYGNPALKNNSGPFVEEYQLFTNIVTLLHALIPDEN